jgi:hypothetical protein
MPDLFDRLEKLNAYELMQLYEESADVYKVLAVTFAALAVLFVMLIAILPLPTVVCWYIAAVALMAIGFEWASIRLAFFCRDEYQKAKEEFYRICGV